jgi:hypothetical protein
MIRNLIVYLIFLSENKTLGGWLDRDKRFVVTHVCSKRIQK